MRALYVHENRYWEKNGAFYTVGQFGKAYWQSYTPHFDHMTIIGRRQRQPFKNVELDSLLEVNDAKLSMVLLPNLSRLSALLKNSSYVRRQIKALVAAHDVIIIRAATLFGWIAFREARRLGKRVVTEMTGCAWDGIRHYPRWEAFFYAPIRYWRARFMTKNSDAVLYVTQSFLQKRYPSNAFQAAISNVDVQDKPLAERQFDKKLYRIGLIGSLDNRLKGIDVAIKALKQVDVRATLHILGGGDKQPHFDLAHQIGVADRVFFEGVLPSGEAVSNWLDTIDLYIQPSRHEGLPRALIEAMSRGCPALGSDAGGMNELLPPVQRHKVGDVSVLSKQIQFALSCPNRLKAMSCQNYNVSKTYNANILKRKRHHFWQHIAKIQDIIAIGPQRCGTTWLDRYLRARQDISLPKYVKETFYIDRYYNRGLGWYKKQFDRRFLQQAEMAASYFYDQTAPQRINETFGKNVRLICPLRDPIERAVSHYKHYKQYGIARGSFFEAIKTHPEIIQASQYSVHLSRWYEVYEPSDMLILPLSLLETDAETYVRLFCDYTGMAYKPPLNANMRENIASVARNAWMAGCAQLMATTLRHVGLAHIVMFAKKMGLKDMFFTGGKDSHVLLTSEEKAWLENKLSEEKAFYDHLVGSLAQSWHNELEKRSCNYG